MQYTLRELRSRTDNELSIKLRHCIYEQAASASYLHREQAQRKIDWINKVLDERHPERIHS